MASYSVLIKPSAAKELEELPIKTRRKVVARVVGLADDPRPRGCVKLSGEEKYRLRQGDLRILYEINDDDLTVTLVKIGHRRNVYRKAI